MKKINIALLIGFIFTIIVSNISAFAQSYDELKDSVVRFHILANSDSEEDQNLKLKVRDRILETGAGYFEGSSSVKQTEQIITDNIENIRQIAESVIKENGYNYSVNCELVNMYFDERVYDDFTLPAGYYDALRVTIGEAKGHNWWCVMYPPLCLPAAMDEEEFENCFSEEEIDMIKNPQKYEVKFKIAEIIEKWFDSKEKKTELQKSEEINGSENIETTD